MSLKCLLISQTAFIIAENPLRRLHLQIGPIYLNRKASAFEHPIVDYLGHAYTFFLHAFKSLAVTVDLNTTTNCQRSDPGSWRYLKHE